MACINMIGFPVEYGKKLETFNDGIEIKSEIRSEICDMLLRNHFEDVVSIPFTHTTLLVRLTDGRKIKITLEDEE